MSLFGGGISFSMSKAEIHDFCLRQLEKHDLRGYTFDWYKERFHRNIHDCLTDRDKMQIMCDYLNHLIKAGE